MPGAPSTPGSGCKTLSASRGRSSQTRGLSQETKCRPHLTLSLSGLCAHLEMPNAQTKPAASPVPAQGPQTGTALSPATPPNHATFLPTRSGQATSRPEFQRGDKPTGALQAKLRHLGLPHNPRLPGVQDSGSHCQAWNWPLGCNRDPLLHNQEGNRTQPMFGFGNKKQHGFYYFSWYRFLFYV